MSKSRMLVDFIEEVETNINTNGIKRYGDGHSLGGHLIVSVALIEKNFDDVRGLNDAPVNLKLATFMPLKRTPLAIHE
ncbi:DUF6792 domain-containing protein [Shouchella clausii]|uniref:DUF6792 domain-containing protein n=1 Tax=Shouchella clausii TaxID=79880 RepID=UPI00311DA09A